MLRSMLSSCDGSVAAMSGFAIVLIAFASGGAIDFSNAMSQRSSLQDSADAAVLSAATFTGSDDDRAAFAEHFFAESPFCKRKNCGTPVATSTDGIISLTVEADVPTSLLQIVGWDTLSVNAQSQATSRGGPLEVVMVLDYSSSMTSSNKYQNMRTAAVSFLDNAIARPGGKVDVGLAPFARYVMSPISGSYLNDIVEGDNLDGVDVVGCTMNRAYPHSISVATPSAGNGSRWPVVSYAPGSDPTAGGYSDTSEYEEDESDHDCQDYADRHLWTRPMSDDLPALKTAVNAMTPASGTNIALGLDVGWHLLSDNAPFVEAATGEEDAKQVMILLTDGEQTVDADGPSGFGTTSANSNIASICTAMKADEIEVFVVAFDVADNDTRTLLRNCATDEPFYYEPGVEDQLNVIFDGIYNVISAGRARLTG